MIYTRWTLHASSIAQLIYEIVLVNIVGEITIPGENYGIIMDSIGLRDHFNRSTFLIVRLLFLVELLFPLSSLLWAMLIYREANFLIMQKTNWQI